MWKNCHIKFQSVALHQFVFVKFMEEKVGLRHKETLQNVEIWCLFVCNYVALHAC